MLMNFGEILELLNWITQNLKSLFYLYTETKKNINGSFNIIQFNIYTVYRNILYTVYRNVLMHIFF